MFQIDNSATGASNNAFSDLVFYIYHAADLTTKLKFDIANTAGVETLFQTTGTANQTIIFPDGNNDLMGTSSASPPNATSIPFRNAANTFYSTSPALMFDVVGDGVGHVNILQLGGSANFIGDFTTISAFPYAIDGGHRFNGTLTINAADPISDTDYFLNGFTGSVIFNDNYSSSTLTKSGLSAAGSFMILEGAAGKTVDKISNHEALFAISAASLGGTVTEAASYSSNGILDLGGTAITFVNYYGYKHENILGVVPTNEWGVYVGGADAENYFERGIAIATTSKKVTNASVGFEIGGTSKALRVSNMTTAQKNALTPLAGMILQDTTLGSLSTYNGSAWVEPLLNPMTTGGDIIYGGASGVPTRLANGTSGYYLKSAGGTSAPSWSAFTPPTVQRFTSSGTYTTPAGVKYIRVLAVGGGGGGAGGGNFNTAGDGSNGTASTFGTSSLINAAGGGLGGKNGDGGVSGFATITAPALNAGNVSGSGNQTYGGAGMQNNSASNVIVLGGGGADSILFGGGGRSVRSGAGAAGLDNTGGGGQGGSATATATAIFGGGGGASGCSAVAIIPSPSATYAVVIGSGGSGGTAGTNGSAGGAGGSGLIVVEEYYQ